MPFLVVYSASPPFPPFLSTSCSIFNIKVPMVIKASITNLQQVQFLIMNAQAGYILWNGCEYPNRIVVAYLLYIDTLMILFRNFQNKKYDLHSCLPPTYMPAPHAHQCLPLRALQAFTDSRKYYSNFRTSESGV